MQKRAFRVNLDLRNEKIGYKIREHTLARVPYMVIIGDKEVASELVSVRLPTGETETLALEAFFERLDTQILNKK